MADLLPPGQAALRNLRRSNPPPGFGPRQVMSPTHNLLRASFTYIDRSIHRQRDAEEASARRVMFEAQLEFEASQRENLLRQELQRVAVRRGLDPTGPTGSPEMGGPGASYLRSSSPHC